MSNPDMFNIEAIGERLRTQDNLYTRDPMFLVQEKRRVYGIDTEFDPPIAWLYDDESVEVDAQEAARLEARYQASFDEEKGYRRVGYHESWEFVTCCLTQAAADLYIRQMKHRHTGDLRVYVDSAYRNWEWIAVRDYLTALAEVKGVTP